MKAVSFKYSLPSHLLVGAVANRWPGVMFQNFASVQLRDVEEPELLGPHWVKLKPRLAGICWTV